MTKRLRPLIFPGDGTALVQLTRGMVAVIDEADAPLVEGLHWHALRGRNGTWYAKHNRYGVNMLLHRRITGAGEGEEVDHEDGDGLHNRRRNLRVTDRLGNARNMAARSSRGTGFFGVKRHKSGRYVATITIGGRGLHLGYHATVDDARAARARAEADLIGIAPRRREELELWLS